MPASSSVSMPFQLLRRCSNKIPFTRLWTKDFSSAKSLLERIAHFGNVGSCGALRHLRALFSRTLSSAEKLYCVQRRRFASLQLLLSTVFILDRYLDSYARHASRNVCRLVISVFAILTNNWTECVNFNTSSKLSWSTNALFIKT
jgi:hypothetical protein